MQSRRFKVLITAVLFFLLPITAVFADDAKILFGKDYFESLHKAINDAKESIIVAMYIINIPQEDNANPASVLVNDLIDAGRRGVYVKVLLDDTKLNINYNAFKKLESAGIDVSFDAPFKLLHGKGIVIDSIVSFIGSTNWTKAALEDNHEFSILIESKEIALKLIDYISNIKSNPHLPPKPQKAKGISIPRALLTNEKFLPPLFTSHSEKAFDLYLYLVRKSQRENSPNVDIDYKELGEYLGYAESYYFNVRQPLNKLVRRYNLIRHKPWAKYLTVSARETASGLDEDVPVTIPYTYWTYGFDKRLSFNAKYMYLVSLLEADQSTRNPYWFRSNHDLANLYHIGERSVSQGVKELESENILEVYRHRPEEPGNFEDRPANVYRLNPLISEEDFKTSLKALSAKYGEELTKKAQELSSQLNEPKDIGKIETFITLINTYGYDRVKKVNSEVASKRLETGFRSIDQTIQLLKERQKNEKY